MPAREMTDARILVVDDQESNVQLLERLLRLKGYSDIECLTDSRQTVGRFVATRPDSDPAGPADAAHVRSRGARGAAAAHRRRGIPAHPDPHGRYGRRDQADRALDGRQGLPEQAVRRRGGAAADPEPPRDALSLSRAPRPERAAGLEGARAHARARGSPDRRPHARWPSPPSTATTRPASTRAASGTSPRSWRAAWASPTRRWS